MKYKNDPYSLQRVEGLIKNYIQVVYTIFLHVHKKIDDLIADRRVLG